jgi:YesN/AraC family two-component response regulator
MYKVLVVDDEPFLRAFMVRLLRESQFFVLEARDGAEALQHLEGDPVSIDIVLTDVRMPNMDGLQLADAVRTRWPRIRLLLMSGFPLSRSEEPEFRDFPFISKPFREHELLTALTRILPPQPAA